MLHSHMKYIIDRGYDHTEFELLRKLFGQDEAVLLMKKKVDEERIKKNIDN